MLKPNQLLKTNLEFKIMASTWASRGVVPVSKPDENNQESVVNTLRKMEGKGHDASSLCTLEFCIAGSTVEVLTDIKSTFTGLMFQDSLMKSVFSSYPKVMLVDVTYKLIDLRMPVYCTDGTDKVNQFLCS